jgi:small-conductance mechanosensitive channel
MILSAHILNYSVEANDKGLILHTTVTLAYSTPWRTVHRLLIQAALGVEGILTEPPPFVLQTSLNDVHVTYELNAFTRMANRMETIVAELHGRIQDEFNQAGLELLSPAYLALRDGNAVAIPKTDRPVDYTAPAFHVRIDTNGEAADFASRITSDRTVLGR